MLRHHTADPEGQAGGKWQLPAGHCPEERCPTRPRLQPHHQAKFLWQGQSPFSLQAPSSKFGQKLSMESVQPSSFQKAPDSNQMNLFFFCLSRLEGLQTLLCDDVGWCGGGGAGERTDTLRCFKERPNSLMKLAQGAPVWKCRPCFKIPCCKHRHSLRRSCRSGEGNGKAHKTHRGYLKGVVWVARGILMPFQEGS